MDLKIGMLGGTVLCLAGIVWFCAKQQIAPSPLSKLQRLAPPANKTNTGHQDGTPIGTAPPYKETSAWAKAHPTPTQSAASKSDNNEQIIHTVTQGQTLTDISRIYYNTSSGWNKIYEANKEKLPRGPDMIRAGMRLVIPENR